MCGHTLQNKVDEIRRRASYQKKGKSFFNNKGAQRLTPGIC